MGKKIKIAIIGLGLIGGSIYKSLDKRKYEVIAISKSQKGKNIFDKIENVKNSDIVFICSNMSETQNVLDELDKILDKKTIVADTCSIKSFLEEKDYSFDFIMSHPMAGTEKSGYSASFKGLFKDAKWVITKDNKTLKKIIKDLGAKPVLMDKITHDKTTALISHMPNILSCALFDMIKDNKDAKLLASSGFRDMTRLAMSNENLIADMFEYNEENILHALNKLQESINKFKKMPRDEKMELIKDNAKKRKEMYKNGKNTTN